MPVKLLHHRRKTSRESKKGKTANRESEMSRNESNTQPEEPMLVVLNPSDRDSYWENHIEKMNMQLNKSREEQRRLKVEVKELKAAQAQAPSEDRPNFQREIEQKQHAIRHSRADSIIQRTHLQINDEKAPGEITGAFRTINRDVDDLCRDINEDLARTYNASRGPAIVTSLDVRDMAAVQQILYGGTRDADPLLIRSSTGAGRPIDEFMDFSLQFLINKALVCHVFQPFNPLISPEENECISRLYENVRRRDAQVLSGRWRISTFACQSAQYSKQEWLDSLYKTVANGIILPFLVAVYGPSAQLLPKHYQSIASLISKAFRWNQMVKSEVILLDFQPAMYINGTLFDPSSMEPLNSKSVPGRTEPIISTVSLGLQSSEAVGGGKSPIRVWQTKVAVLTPIYFDS